MIDDRKKIKRSHFILDENKNYKKIIIPKNVWYAFKGLDNENLSYSILSVEHKNTKIIKKGLNIKIMKVMIQLAVMGVEL